MGTRGFHEVIQNGTDRKYCAQLGWSLLSIAVGIACMTWLNDLHPYNLVNRVLTWIGAIAVVVGASGTLFHLVAYSSYLRKLSRAEQERLHREQVRVRESRRPVREAVRGFAEMLETNYGWVVAMDPLEAQRQALLWYDQIVSKWGQENEQWFNLRSSDHWEEVLTDLGTMSTRMLDIWKRRRALYQYAVAYSTEATRAKEILAIEREIRQLQVREARAKHEFELQLREEGSSELAERRRQ